PTLRGRRTDAEDHGNRDRRPAPASRARDHHRRPRELPARPGDRRQGGEAPHLRNDPTPRWGETMATGGEIRWPPAGRNDGHQWGIKWPPVGRNRWPLTPGAGTCRLARSATSHRLRRAPAARSCPAVWYTALRTRRVRRYR